MATNTAQTQAHGGEKPPFPPFQKETFASQLVWFALFFIALYLLMSRVALPRVGGIIQARTSQIEGDLAEAGPGSARRDRGELDIDGAGGAAALEAELDERILGVTAGADAHLAARGAIVERDRAARALADE